MFVRDFLYTFKIIFRAKTTLFWTLVFPICLTTFMYVSFGNLMEMDEMFHDIPVAVVTNGSTGDGASGYAEDLSNDNDGTDADEARAAGVCAMLDALSDGDDALLSVSYVTEDEALDVLSDGTVEGVIYADEVRLVVAENSANSSILESVLSQYRQYEYALTELYADTADGNQSTEMSEAKSAAGGNQNTEMSEPASVSDISEIQALAQSISSGVSYYTERGSTDGSQDEYNNYFFAIFAMSCLFASLSSLAMMNNLQANVSASGMRKCVSPAPKMKFILAELAALLVIQFAVETVTVAYMYALGVNLGDEVPGILLTLLFGCGIGLALGVIVGVRPKPAYGVKIGILTGASMAMCIMADLCMGGIKHQIQLHVPVINKINPAALITDSLYALGVYSDYEVYAENIIILAAETAVLLTIGIIMAGRNRYDSV